MRRANWLSVSYPHADPQALGQRLLEGFGGLLDELFPEPEAPDPLDREAADHEAFAASRCKVYIGPEAHLAQLDAHAAGAGQPPVVLGEPGGGKSARRLR